MNSDYIKVAEITDIPDGKMKMVKLGSREILLANVNSSFYAINNKCTHMGGDLSQGILEGVIVTCPLHGAKFDVTNGKVVSLPKLGFLRPKIKDEQSFKLKIEGNNIMINLD